MARTRRAIDNARLTFRSYSPSVHRQMGGFRQFEMQSALASACKLPIPLTSELLCLDNWAEMPKADLRTFGPAQRRPKLLLQKLQLPKLRLHSIEMLLNQFASRFAGFTPTLCQID